MKIEFRKDRTDFYIKGLLAATALLGVLTFVRVSGFLAASSEAQAMAARMDPNVQGAGSAADVSQLLAPAKASAEELKKSNLFVKTPPKQNPVGEVLGILGDEALINGKWCKVGDTVGDAKIVAIEPTKVKVAWNGEEKEFAPISAAGSGQAGGPPSSRSGGRSGSAGNASAAGTNAGRGPRLSGRMGAGLSSAQRAQMRQRWQSMSPEERQRAREEMRQRLGARRPR